MASLTNVITYHARPGKAATLRDRLLALVDPTTAAQAFLSDMDDFCTGYDLHGYQPVPAAGTCGNAPACPRVTGA
jgi:hypothetical protein